MELAVIGVLLPPLPSPHGSKGPLRGLLGPLLSDGYAMLMSPNEGETAVHGLKELKVQKHAL